MSLLVEVPAHVPNGEGIRIGSKKARRECYQHDRRLRQEAVASAAKAQAQVDKGRCWNLVWAEMEDICQNARVISRGLDLCESTTVRGGVCLEAEMAGVTGTVSGDDGAQDVGASAMELDDSGKAAGKSATLAGSGRYGCAGSQRLLRWGRRPSGARHCNGCAGCYGGWARRGCSSGGGDIEGCWGEGCRVVGRRSRNDRQQTHGLDRVDGVWDRCGGSGHIPG